MDLKISFYFIINLVKNYMIFSYQKIQFYIKLKIFFIMKIIDIFIINLL